jgi:peptidoglycan hydrolase-like protein with peptidoglycan-binding domain
MHKYMTIATALAIGVMWSLGPASAQTTTDRVEQKAESVKDTIKDKAEQTKDTITDKAVEAKDTIKDKAVRAKEKVKETFAHTRDRMRSKTGGDVAMSDTRAAQQALKAQGFDPGPIDGRLGPRTKAAVSDYQGKNDLPVTGMLDEATLTKLEVRGPRAGDVPAASPTTRPDVKKQTE